MPSLSTTFGEANDPFESYTFSVDVVQPAEYTDNVEVNTVNAKATFGPLTAELQEAVAISFVLSDGQSSETFTTIIMPDVIALFEAAIESEYISENLLEGQITI